MTWSEALSWVLRLSSRSSRSALDAVVSRAALGPATEASAVPSRVLEDMLRPVGSATALSRSDTASLRVQVRSVVAVVSAVGTQSSREPEAQTGCALGTVAPRCMSGPVVRASTRSCDLAWRCTAVPRHPREGVSGAQYGTAAAFSVKTEVTMRFYGSELV